jgi:hypothetical protein
MKENKIIERMRGNIDEIEREKTIEPKSPEITNERRR